jgi:hypothetical protein
MCSVCVFAPRDSLREELCSDLTSEVITYIVHVSKYILFHGIAIFFFIEIVGNPELYYK